MVGLCNSATSQHATDLRLLQTRADPNLANGDRETPLMLAAEMGNIELVTAGGTLFLKRVL